MGPELPTDWGKKISPRVTLRAATQADAALASRSVIAGWRDSYGAVLPARLLASLDRNPHHDETAWRQAINVATARTLVVEYDGSSIGVVRVDLVSTIPDTQSELTTLYIESAHRGRGIGGWVLHEVFAVAAQSGALSLGVCVLTGNTRGRHFYVQHGAKVTGERVAFHWEGQAVSETTLAFVPLAHASIHGSV
ncbi:MAG: GNAT family N-acetyltransferase [Hyphomicrobiaceae bacterium]